jgi:hypothetical protein
MAGARHQPRPDLTWPNSTRHPRRGTNRPPASDGHASRRRGPSGHRWCLARDAAVTNVSQVRRGRTRTNKDELPSPHGPSPTLPRRRRLVPRDDPRQQPRTVLPRRRRSPRLPPPAAPRDPQVRMAAPRPLPAREPLPPPRRDTRTEPLAGHAGPERRVRPRLQRPPRPLRPRFREALLLTSRRDRGASRDRAGVHPPEPRRRRARRARRRLALDVDSRTSPFVRVAEACLTTPTS